MELSGAINYSSSLLVIIAESYFKLLYGCTSRKSHQQT
jgi:hypothetical protein